MGRWALAGMAVVVVAGAALIFLMPRKPAPPPPPPPSWAFPVSKPSGAKVVLDDTIPRHVPGSSVSFTQKGTGDRFMVPDWHPDGHPALPDVVAHGRKPDVFACGYCHLPNGQGRPENAPLAGQPAAYLMQQVQEMAEGRRHTSQAKMGPPKSMVQLAKHIDGADLRTAAAYFAGLTYRPWIRVVETDTVPVTEIDSHSMWAPVPGGGTEALGQRIVETAEDMERTELRDDASGFVAYVPKGSVARGEALVRGAGVQACRSCHGPKLNGMAGTPALAGRSPSYIARQLFDIQYGARSGVAVAPMRAVVANLTEDKRIAIAAYLASLKP